MSGFEFPKPAEDGSSIGCPQGRFQLPGLNLPLNWTPREVYQTYVGSEEVTFAAQGDGKELFPNALNESSLYTGSCSLPLLTLREFSMLHIMNSLTDKPGWEEKVFNDEIAAKWKSEAMSTPGADVTQKMIDYVIEEMKWRSALFKETGAVFVYNGDVVKSDTAIPTELKTALRNAVKPLENVPAVYKDYHPGSDGQVLDLVHPSLFPLIYGRSRVLDDRAIGLADCINNIGKGKILPIRPDKEMILDRTQDYRTHSEEATPWSKNYQWLPSDVEITNGEASITSYINNLHPQHYQDLYQVTNQIISKIIPLWTMTLSKIRTYNHLKRIKYQYKINHKAIANDEKPQQMEGEDEYDYEDRLNEWKYSKAVPGEPEEFKVPEISAYVERERTDLIRDFSHRGLQVIVKLATIELAPENPEYGGGSWHVEGQLNEHICATALYYYDNTNISDSYLAFRQQANEDDTRDMGYPQSMHSWLTEVFGVKQNGPTVQEVGSVLCKEDRLLTFPNLLQHRVHPFKLANPTKPGHRKILALFLVDPHIRVISTANVPPQQRDWWSERLETTFVGKEDTLGKLSNELNQKVYEAVDDFPIGMDEAKEIRLKLMDERKSYAAVTGKNFLRTNTFNLCEH